MILLTSLKFIACPTCQRIILDVEKVKSGKAISKDDDNDQDSVSCKGRGKYVSKGIDALGFEPATHDSSWITKSDKDPNFPLVPSSKTLALKSILWRGFEEAPLDKVSTAFSHSAFCTQAFSVHLCIKLHSPCLI